jgi:hypothetical protein
MMAEQGRIRRMKRSWHGVLLVAAIAAGACAASRPSPIVSEAAPATSSSIGPREEAEPLVGKPPAAQRAYMGWGVVSVPSFFQVEDGQYDLVIHFHGGQHLQEENFERIKLNAIVVSVNLGIGSGPYSAMFDAPGSLDTALERIQAAMDKAKMAPGAKVRRIALSSWSAGFGGLSGMLAQKGVADRIDAVLLGDSLHANFIGDMRDHKVNPAAVENYVAFARRAAKGEKLFAMTHSAIGVDGYASTTEVAAELCRLIPIEQKKPGFTWPEGMHALYEAHEGNLHIIGFDGTREPDHILHVTQMYKTTLPWLKAWWHRK